MNTILILNIASAFILALIHLYGKNFLSKKEINRISWLSFAGGTSVAYVFIHILPQLADDDTVLKEFFGLEFLKHHVYLVSLFGLLFFYGLEKSLLLSKKEKLTSTKKIPIEKLFWFHISSYAIYNSLIGYLLVNSEEQVTVNVIFFTIAMGFHFLINDASLRDHFKDIYDKKGRIVLALAVISGFVIGNLVTIHEAGVAVLRAFISGGIILTVLKEELPEEKKSNFFAFAIGAVVYTLLLLLLD